MSLLAASQVFVDVVNLAINTGIHRSSSLETGDWRLEALWPSKARYSQVNDESLYDAPEKTLVFGVAKGGGSGRHGQGPQFTSDPLK